MKPRLLQHCSGFTIAELMVYIAVSSLLTIGMYQTFNAQQKSYVTQNYLTEIQQSLRSGMYLMTKDIRSTGYNPSGRAAVGFVDTFAAPNDKFVINYALATNMIALTTDADGDGSVDPNALEQIAYRHNAANRTLERFISTNVLPGGTWEAVLDNVDAVNFLYLQGNGAVATAASDIRTVEIALLVRSRSPDAQFLNTTVYKNKQGTVLCPTCANDHYHRRLLTTTVQARNLS